MFAIDNALSLFDFMVNLNHDLNLLIVEKLCLLYAEVTGKVQPILIKVKTLGNFNLSQSLIAFARLFAMFFAHVQPVSFSKL